MKFKKFLISIVCAAVAGLSLFAFAGCTQESINNEPAEIPILVGLKVDSYLIKNSSMDRGVEIKSIEELSEFLRTEYGVIPPDNLQNIFSKYNETYFEARSLVLGCFYYHYLIDDLDCSVLAFKDSENIISLKVEYAFEQSENGGAATAETFKIIFFEIDKKDIPSDIEVIFNIEYKINGDSGEF